MNIAVIGAGVSGLVTALLLSEAHQVTVYEANGYAGGHTNTVEVETERGSYAVDTGFIVFNDRNYPNFERLLARLGVDSQPSNMSFSVADERGRYEYAATGPNGLFATRSNLVNPRFLRMIAEVPRFQRACLALLEDGGDDDAISLAGFLAREGFSPSFVNRLILPQAAAVWSADPRAMHTFPASFLATFFKNHGMLELRGRPNWRVIRGGSRSYVQAILARLGDRVRLNAPVTGVSRGADAVTVITDGHPPESFDQVVIATHSDQALAMLDDATDTERELLEAIPYQSNQAVLHTDVSLLPRRRRAWASWNYHLLSPPSDRATVTYHMNRLQSLDAPQEFCVTLNRTEAIDPATIIARFDYAHPVYSPEGVLAQARVDEISGRDRIHFCGAYWGWGFHEDGVVSAVRVAEALGARL